MRPEQVFVRFERWGFDRRGWSENTRRHYLASARSADRWLREQHGTPLVKARRGDLEDFIASRKGRTARNRNNLRQALLGFFDFLVDTGVRPDNPASGIPRLRQPRGVPKALTVEQAEQVIVAAQAHGPDWHLMVLLMLYAGLRHREAHTLEWSAFEGDGSWLRFRAKGGHERVMPLHPCIPAAAARWRPGCRSARWVFPSPRWPQDPVGRECVAVHIREIGGNAGVAGLHPHVLRHTYATRLIELGADIRTVQEAMGHAQLSSTQVYLRARPSRVAEAVGRLDFRDARPSSRKSAATRPAEGGA